MKHLIIVGIFVTLCSACQWLVMNPAVIPEAEAVVEEVYKDYESYEHGHTLSPAPAVGVPSNAT
jgi:hypothetical protein